MDVKVHLSNPVPEFRLPCMRTDRLELILKVVLKLLVFAGGVTIFVPKANDPKVRVVRSTLAGSS